MNRIRSNLKPTNPYESGRYWDPGTENTANKRSPGFETGVNQSEMSPPDGEKAPSLSSVQRLFDDIMREHRTKEKGIEMERLAVRFHSTESLITLCAGCFSLGAGIVNGVNGFYIVSGIILLITSLGFEHAKRTTPEKR